MSSFKMDLVLKVSYAEFLISAGSDNKWPSDDGHLFLTRRYP